MTEGLLAVLALLQGMTLWVLTDIKTDLRDTIKRVNQHEQWLIALRAKLTGGLP